MDEEMLRAFALIFGGISSDMLPSLAMLFYRHLWQLVKMTFPEAAAYSIVAIRKKLCGVCFMSSNSADRLDPDRIVYHRGSVVYARLKDGGEEDYRHPLDVSNGLECGCVCDECNELLLGCANDPEKREAGVYKKIAYFAHQSNSECAPKGERGLLEAFRLVIDASRKILLPAACQRLGDEQVLNVPYRVAAVADVHSLSVEPRQPGDPYSLLVETSLGTIRLLVVVNRPRALIAKALERKTCSIVTANMVPGVGGIIQMRDVLAAVNEARGFDWEYYPEMEADKAAQAEKIRLSRATEQIRSRETGMEPKREVRVTYGGRVKEKKVDISAEEAVRRGWGRVLCAACKTETCYGPPAGDWRYCTVCGRYTNFWPMD